MFPMFPHVPTHVVISIFMAVDLPVPFGPKKPKTLPLCIARLRSSNALTFLEPMPSLNSFEIPSILIIKIIYTQPITECQIYIFLLF